MIGVSTIGNATLIVYDKKTNIQYLSKYADNGRAETIPELEEYFKLYKQRSGREYIYQTFLDKSKNIFNRFISNDRGSLLYRKVKQTYYYLK